MSEKDCVLMLAIVRFLSLPSSFDWFCSKKTLIPLGLGKIVSLLITSTAFSSSELAKKGNSTALFLFLAPVITFRRIIKSKSTEQFSGVLYISNLLNCLHSAWASDYEREFDGSCLGMRLSYSPIAHLFPFLVQWTDCCLAGALGLLRILIYKAYVDGKTTMPIHERKGIRLSKGIRWCMP